MEYKYTGIILSKRDVGEADRIYTFYALEAGKITALASSVRKPQAKLAGSLESLNLVDIFVNRARGMGKITGAVVENNFPKTRSNYAALKLVLRAAAVVNGLIQSEEKDKRIFKLLLEFLESMDKEQDEEKMGVIFHGFIFKLMELLGYELQINYCANCSGALLEKGKNYFNARAGGIICEKCFLARNDSLSVSANAVKLLRIFSKNRISSLAKIKIGSREMGEVEKISRNFLAWIGTGK